MDTTQQLAQKHAIEVQLLAIKCGAVYGALAFAGLISAHIVAHGWLGVSFALLGAFFAYLNFTLIASSAHRWFVTGSMVASVTCGLISGALLWGYL